MTLNQVQFLQQEVKKYMLVLTIMVTITEGSASTSHCTFQVVIHLLLTIILPDKYHYPLFTHGVTSSERGKGTNIRL